MTPLRRKRLLILASTINADHKRWYSEYLKLIGEGLVTWRIGIAFLTELGRVELDRLKG